MKITFIILIIFVVVVLKCNAQNYTFSRSKIVTYVYKNVTLNVSITNIPSGTSSVFSCLIPKVDGYSKADISLTDYRNNVYSILLSNFEVGRVSEIQCGLGGNLTEAIPLSVKPDISAFVCDDISVVTLSSRTTTTTVSVRFTELLPEAAKINCSSSNLQNRSYDVPIGIITYSMPIIFNNNTKTSETVQCTFTMSPFQNNFPFSAIFNKPEISFSQSSVISDSPSFNMNMFINYQPYEDVILTCRIITDGNNTTNCTNLISNSTFLNWTITDKVTFPANSSVSERSITLLKLFPRPGTQENFMVSCCNDVYKATSTVTVNHPPIDNALQASVGPTVYPYLRFYQMSPCPCDLTVDQCDLNCCCDPACDCSSPNVIPISGPYGGYFNDTAKYSCQTPYELTTQPYHSLLCVQFNTSNMLGYYYNDTDLLQTAEAFQVALSSVTRSGFQFTMATQEISINKITAYSASSTLPQSLSLPKRIVNSISCDINSAIVFLEEYNSSCPITVTADNCQTDLRLSYTNYLLSSTVTQTTCTPKMTLTNINQSTPVYTFYKSENSSYRDNGYNTPNRPSISGTACLNVVKSVKYTLAYNAATVVYIRADVELGSVNLSNTVLYQYFGVSFVNTNATTASLDNRSLLSILIAATSLENSQIKKSGLYGYEDGLPVIMNNNSLMKTFALDVTGTCQKASLGRNVLFHKDSFIQCQFQFLNASCLDRRVEVKKYLDSFLDDLLVAKYGNPQTVDDYVNVTTFFNASSNSSTPSRNQNTSIVVAIDSMSSSFCENITTGVTLQIYYSRQGKVRGQYIHNIRGVQRKYVLGNFTSFSPNGGALNQSQQITLTYSVEFILIPANIPGDQSTEDRSYRVCSFDVCIEELLYPWLMGYEGKQGFYEQAFGVMLLGLAVFLLVTTYPWW